MERVERPVARITGVIEPSESLSSAEASCSRALEKKNSRRLGRGKVKARREHWEGGRNKGGFFPLPLVPRAPVFISPALPFQFLSMMFTKRSLCGGESERVIFSEPRRLSDLGVQIDDQSWSCTGHAIYHT